MPIRVGYETTRILQIFASVTEQDNWAIDYLSANFFRKRVPKRLDGSRTLSSLCWDLDCGYCRYDVIHTNVGA